MAYGNLCVRRRSLEKKSNENRAVLTKIDSIIMASGFSASMPGQIDYPDPFIIISFVIDSK
jgi:hypothetical protein